MVRCKIAALTVVRADAVEHVILVAVAVHQHHGNLRLAVLGDVGRRVHANDNDAVERAVFGNADVAFLGVDPGDEDMEGCLARFVLHHAQKIAVKRVAEHEVLAGFRLRNHHADELGSAVALDAAGPQRLCRLVGHVLERFDRHKHFFACFRP
ncbi:hypothetical protein SDC9_93270 [bioreactor metagenome]|uniref:Uncharacterized protein n=1 Tax=bioreactor metagenome TaxID=1076179 RepID=A0A645A0W5_9ZZZZ